jgi:hypothetical protein
VRILGLTDWSPSPSLPLPLSVIHAYRLIASDWYDDHIFRLSAVSLNRRTSRFLNCRSTTAASQLSPCDLYVLISTSFCFPFNRLSRLARRRAMLFFTAALTLARRLQSSLLGFFRGLFSPTVGLDVALVCRLQTHKTKC